jgi:hypothetical protein
MQIKTELENTIGELITRLSILNQIEINTLPDDHGWTAGQIGEHLLKSYEVAGMLTAPVVPTQRLADEKVEGIKSVFLNFDIKMKSPAELEPSQSIIDRDLLIQNLAQKKAELIKIAETFDLTLTCMGFVIPQYGPFTRLEWLSFIVIHTQRHLHQLESNSL